MATFDFLINDTTASAQDAPAAARLADGKVVVAWTSLNQDGSGAGVYFRRLDQNGGAVGEETRANATTVGGQLSPAIAALKDGGFVIAWTSAGQDGDGNGVYAQRFNRLGEPVGLEFRVADTTAGGQLNPDVAALEDGGFVIVWEDTGADGAISGVFQKRYSRLGAPLGAETRVNATTFDQQDQPAVAGLQTGGWVVAWASEHLGAFGPEDREIFLQRFGAAGAPLGPEARVSSAATTHDDAPRVETLGSGDFVVAWTAGAETAQLRGQVFHADGTRRGPERALSDPAVSDQQKNPAVAALDNGGFAVAWQDMNAPETVQERVFNANGAAIRAQTAAGASPHGGGADGVAAVGFDGGGFGVFWETRDEEIAGVVHDRGTARDDIQVLTARGLFLAGAGADYIQGSNSDDDIFGGAGPDLIYGRGGDDLLDAGKIGSATDADVIYGGSGLDVIDGSDGLDRLYGQGGADLIMGKPGDDTIDGGGGTDFLKGGLGDDEIWGQTGDDAIRGGEGDDYIRAGAGDDEVRAGLGDDLVHGEADNDLLEGLGGDDLIFGGLGDDEIRGGSGDDVMVGGAGTDVFVFGFPTFGDDGIRDFENGVDRIDMAGSGAAGFGALTIRALGPDAMVRFGEGSILLFGMAGALDAGDFTF